MTSSSDAEAAAAGVEVVWPLLLAGGVWACAVRVPTKQNASMDTAVMNAAWAARAERRARFSLR